MKLYLKKQTIGGLKRRSIQELEKRRKSIDPEVLKEIEREIDKVERDMHEQAFKLIFGDWIPPKD